MKKSTLPAIICATVLLCAVATVFMAIPFFRYRAYHADEPLFMGKPVLQKLVYHDSDIVMLHGEDNTVIYNGNVYVGQDGTGWLFDDQRMQYAGKIHQRKILHFYCNYDVHVSEKAVTEQGTPIFLSCNGVQPFYCVLQDYPIPDIMTAELVCEVPTKQGTWRTQASVKLGEIVDLTAPISYSQDMQELCTAIFTSYEYNFMYTYAPICRYEDQYYLHMGLNVYYPITAEELIGILEQDS